jgi:hypothetical protein
MQTAAATEPYEKLVRLQAERRASSVELRVHYEVSRKNGCATYRIITVDEVDSSTVTH